MMARWEVRNEAGHVVWSSDERHVPDKAALAAKTAARADKTQGFTVYRDGEVFTDQANGWTGAAWKHGQSWSW